MLNYQNPEKIKISTNRSNSKAFSFWRAAGGYNSPPTTRILDITNYEVEVGCPALKKEISKKKPTIHIFGHLHDNYGKVMRKDITYINATSFYNHLKLTNLPIQVEIPD